ncbi:MAG: hypothetical protein IH986_07120 [Planctomycetes bacterium]|nr:hypothetical protein [Planctomycetota bacterium]
MSALRFHMGMLALAITIGGCAYDGDLSIPVDTAEPFKASFSANQARIVDDRYALLPIVTKRSQSVSIFSGRTLISGSAWSGFGFSSAGNLQLNLEVVDLETNAHMRVFDRQVALGHWQQWTRRDPLNRLHFTSVLILLARVEDTDQDGKITSRDASALYRFDLAERRRRRISPEGYHVSSFFFQSDQIVLFLLQEPKREETSVYVYTPATDKSRFVAQALKP